jgi:hypothetical protein
LAEGGEQAGDDDLFLCGEVFELFAHPVDIALELCQI